MEPIEGFDINSGITWTDISNTSNTSDTDNITKKFIDKQYEYDNTQKEILRNISKNKGWEVVRKRNNPKRTSKKCYTCYPRKKVKAHIIQEIDDITFHHDMCNRNIIVVTPRKHFSNMSSCENIDEIFRNISKFCEFWKIEDYNVSYNQGNWQTNKHFHLKIKTHENVIKRMRGDHFVRKGMEKRYTQ
jgi:hypothetical protein